MLFTKAPLELNSVIVLLLELLAYKLPLESKATPKGTIQVARNAFHKSTTGIKLRNCIVVSITSIQITTRIKSYTKRTIQVTGNAFHKSTTGIKLRNCTVAKITSI